VLALQQWFTSRHTGGCGTYRRARAILRAAVERGWTLQEVWRVTDDNLRSHFKEAFHPTSQKHDLRVALDEVVSVAKREQVSEATKKALRAEERRLKAQLKAPDPTTPVAMKPKKGSGLNASWASSYVVTWGPATRPPRKYFPVPEDLA
jgi:hypothetical protein